MEDYNDAKYRLDSAITLGDNNKVPIIVGITIKAKALSTKFIAISRDAIEATIIINT